jgi:hypothetical protein
VRKELNTANALLLRRAIERPVDIIAARTKRYQIVSSTGISKQIDEFIERYTPVMAVSIRAGGSKNETRFHKKENERTLG